jgi:hypothetical protein
LIWPKNNYLMFPRLNPASTQPESSKEKWDAIKYQKKKIPTIKQTNCQLRMQSVGTTDDHKNVKN